jgi:hypothetical protein
MVGDGREHRRVPPQLRRHDVVDHWRAADRPCFLALSRVRIVIEHGYASWL